MTKAYLALKGGYKSMRCDCTHVSDLVVLGEAVVVEDGEPQRLVEGVRVGQVLELELLEGR